MAKAKKLADKDIASFIKKVASAGRGGDTELAFLSASARDLLKKLGGAGTKNPKTGLKEYRAAAKFAKSRAEQAEPMGLFGNTPVTPTTPVVPAASPAPLSVASPFQPSSMAPDIVTRQAEPEERAPVRGSAAADMQQFNTASTGPSAAQREAERQAAVRAQQEAAQQEAARQAQARAQQEAARQAAEQQARERAQQEAARVAEERAQQEASRKAARERAQQEAAQKESARQAQIRAQQEAAQKAAEERAQQEAARQAAEQQAQARAQQEAAARAAAQEQARLQAEAAMRAQERERAAALINAQGPRFTEQAQVEPESEQVRPQPGSAAADLQQLSGAQNAQPETTQPQATQPPASVPTNLNAAAAAYAAQQERAQQEAARIAAERAQQEEEARIAAVRAQQEEAIRLATAQQAARPQLAPGDRRRQEILEREDLYVRPIDSGIGDRPGMGKTGGRPGGFNPYDEEADRRAQEEAARRAAEEEARRAAEQEAARKAAEEEARRKAEEDARRAAEAEAARRAAEEQARRAAEEEAKRRAEQDAAAARAAEEARRLAEENARRAAEEEARRKAEEARRAAEEEARRKAEEERRKKEEEDKKNKPPGGDTGKPGPGPGAGTTPPGLIDSKLPVSPPPAAAPPPSGGGITFPPAATPPPEKEKPIRTADFIDKNLNGIDDRDEGPSSPPPPQKDKPIRTMDFIDNNRNGIDDRDEKPDRGRPRGDFNFGAIDPNSDIGRLLARIGRPGRGKPGKGGGSPPPQTGGGLPSKPPPTTIPPTAGPPTAGPPTTSPPVTSPPGGGYTPGPIPVTTLPTPGFIANPLPTAPGQGTGTPYFTPTPGSLTPGTIPGNLNLPSLQTSGLPQQALGQNPNLGPGMLGGAENAGYYTDRFGNVILSPGAVKPPGRAKGGPASDKELLALLKGEKKDAYAESLKNFNSARSMLEDLSDMPGETTTEFSSTPISQTVRRATRQPIRQETDRGTARGMAMELESLTAAQEPKRAPDTLAELLKMSESIRSRDAMSAKDLMRDTFGTEKLTKKQLARLGDLMTRRFAEGGDVKKKEDRTLTPYEVLEGVGTGLATGIGKQVEGTAAMVKDPLGTLEYLRNELETFIKEPEKIPQFVKDSVLEKWGQLTSGPQGAGEMLAEFLRLPGGGKGVPKRDIFIGPKAKTWDAEANAQALALEKEGRSPEEIWQATQNFRGADGNWRQEISDDQMFFDVERFRKSPRFMEVDPLRTRAEDFVRSLGSVSMSMYGPERAKYLFGQLVSPTKKPARYDVADFVDNPALENAYPQLFQGLLERSSPFSNTLGQASTKTNLTSIQVPPFYRERGGSDPKRTLVHELQHHIQEKEGWAPGGQPDIWKRGSAGTYVPPDFVGEKYRKAQADRANKDLSREERARAEQVIKDIQETYSAKNLYRNLMGEAEARAAAARTYLTPEERLARPPMMDFDVDFSKQLDLRREGTFPSYYYSGQNPYLKKKE